MDESLQALEERLEQLVPKGLSDPGRERMEKQIDEWAASVDDGASRGGWKWAVGAAAAVLALVAVGWQGGQEPARVAEGPEVPAGGKIPAVAEVRMKTEEDLWALITLSHSRSVEARTDRGWRVAAGSETPHRYWSYEVTEEEELMDEESGYEVRVVSRHEEWVPVTVTQL